MFATWALENRFKITVSSRHSRGDGTQVHCYGWIPARASPTCDPGSAGMTEKIEIHLSQSKKVFHSPASCGRALRLGENPADG